MKISTEAAIISMIKPGLVAVLTPIVIGFGFKIFLGDGKAAAEALGGLLAGVTVSGETVRSGATVPLEFGPAEIPPKKAKSIAGIFVTITVDE